jgi:hypothetical protein
MKAKIAKTYIDETTNYAGMYTQLLEATTYKFEGTMSLGARRNICRFHRIFSPFVQFKTTVQYYEQEVWIR